MTAREKRTGIYVYCITEGEPIRADAGLHPSRAVYSVVHEDLVAVASNVSLEEFGEQALSSNLEDAAWLEREARGHEAVAERVMETRAVLPLKFCTVFLSEAGVSALLRLRQDQFRRALAALRGKQEWELKLLIPGALSDTQEAADREQPSAQSGKEYLTRKATARLRASARMCLVHSEAQRCFETIATCVEDIRLMPVEAGSSLGQTTLMWDAICLVATSGVASFRQRLEALGAELGAKGLALQASGPWPAYHFTHMEQDDGALPGPA